MRVQKMCRRLVLLLLAAACLCQMALAVDPAFRYGSKNVSWVEMDTTSCCSTATRQTAIIPRHTPETG